jgi:hypothetical protein
MTLADLRRAAELLPAGSAVTLPREALLAALDGSENGNGTATASPKPPANDDVDDQWLTAEQVAELLHVSARWAYDHAKILGARHLSRRCVRFSSRAVRRYMARGT